MDDHAEDQLKKAKAGELAKARISKGLEKPRGGAALRRQRFIWNLGFCAKPDLLQWDCAIAYREVMARLFEAMILIPLRFDGRVKNALCPGAAEHFSVVANSKLTPLMIDQNLPGDGAHIWELPKPIGSQPYALRFIAFFDWFELEHRDFRLLRVEIERMDEKPGFVGHHALIDLRECGIWLEAE